MNKYNFHNGKCDKCGEWETETATFTHGEFGLLSMCKGCLYNTKKSQA